MTLLAHGILLVLFLLFPSGVFGQTMIFSGPAGAVVTQCTTANRLLRLTGGNASDCSLLSDDATNVSLTSGQIRVPDGTAAAPPWAFTSETGLGFYRLGAAQVGITGALIPSSVNNVNLGGGTNTFNTVYLGTLVQTPAVRSGSDGTTLKLGAGANTWEIGGSALQPITTNTSFFGVAGNRPLQIFAGTSGIDSTGSYTQTGATIDAVNAAGSLRFGSPVDTILVRDSANALAQRNGVAAQLFMVFNTFTDAANYERGQLQWSANQYIVSTANAGTGSARDLAFHPSGAPTSPAWVMRATTGHLQTSGDNQIDIGASGGNRPRSVYVATSVTVGTATPTAITNIRVYSQIITPAAVGANTCAEQTFTVTGLTTADKVSINPVASTVNAAATQVRVSAADTLAVTYCNVTGGGLTPASGTMTILAVRS